VQTQPERIPVLVNGLKVYLRGSVEYDVDTGARGAQKILDVLTYADVVTRSGCSRESPAVSYTDTNGTRTLVPGDRILPLVGGTFLVR
jgi:hypothetical protein